MRGKPKESSSYWLRPLDVERPSLQERVYAWRSSVYGPVVAGNVFHEKLVEEVEELERALVYGWSKEPAEAADIVIVLMGRAGELGYDLMAEVEKKFAVVEQRSREEQLERDAR
jgi:hypothetical protein